MRTSLLTLTLLTLGVSTVSVNAYLSPDEVFTDLNIVEDSSASSQGTASSEVNTMQEQGMPEQAEASSEPSAMPTAPAQTQETASESDVSSTPPPPTQALPVFYRSGGEEIQIKEEVQPKPQETDSPFYEPPIEPEPEPMEEETPVTEEETELPPEEIQQEPIQEESEQPEEAMQPAAEQSGGMLFSLVGKLKYVAIAIVLGAGGFFFLMRKKPKAATENMSETGVASASDTPDIPPVPTSVNDGPQNVEESSERLQHALEAMGAEEVTPPSSDEKPKDETDGIGFSDVAPPTRS